MIFTGITKTKAGLTGIFLLGFLFLKAQNANVVNLHVQYVNGEAAEAVDERHAFQYDSLPILDAVQKATGATKTDMALFKQYYADTLSNDRLTFINEAHVKGITHEGMEQYAIQEKERYVVMHQNLQELKKEFPSTVGEYSSPHLNVAPVTCNPACTNIGFESGNLSGWNAYDAADNSTACCMSYTGMTGGACGAVTKAAIDPVTNGYKNHTTYQVSITGGTGNDPIAGALIPLVAPGGGSYSCRLGDSSEGGGRVGIIQQTFQVSASNENFTYQYAVLIDEATHSYGQQPYFQVIITDQTTGDTLPCGVYTVTSGGHAPPGFDSARYRIPSYGWTDEIYFKPWTTVFVPLQNYVGDCISIQAVVSDCYPTTPGPHFCYAYFDATCSPRANININASSSCGKDTLIAPVGGTYVWSGPCISGSSTSQKVLVSCSGTYTVTVTSPDGCSDTLQKVITISPAMTLSTTEVSAHCSQNNGSASVTVVSGGIAPYTYLWTPSGQTTASATGLSAGTYTITVTDNNGCAATAKAIISNVSGETATTGTIINENCFNGTNGSATVNVSGGTVPYTYLWNPSGQTNATATGLSAGTYTVTVTDNNGCTSTALATITQPTAIVLNTSTDSANCNQNNGSATVIVVSGGTAPYTYAWNPGGSTNATETGLGAGTYTVTVTDHNGCSQTTTATVGSLNGVTATMGSITEVSCFNATNGSATVNVTGGITPYTYLWNPSGQTTATATGLSAGTYTIIVKDANGCNSSAIANITQPAAIAVNTTEVSAHCNQNNGSATTTVSSGGTAPYTYLWNPSGQITATATGLSAGTYSVTVTDNNGCSQTATAVVGNLSGATITMGAVTDVGCFNGNNGSAAINVVGGTSPYAYLWNPSGQTNVAATGLSANTYTVTVTDANGCTGSASVTITQPNAIVLNTTTDSAHCNENNGSATLSVVSGGTGPYTYAWTPGGNTDATITGLAVGTYTVTVTDHNGCTQTTTAVVNSLNGETATMGATTSVSCFKGINGSATVNVTGGSPPYIYVWTPTGQTNVTATGLSAGNYTVTITDANGCNSSATALITQPPPIIITTSGQTVSCPGQIITLTANATGGSGGPYTYNWTPGGTGQSIVVSPTTTTTYTVMVIDANGCSATTEVTAIIQPEELTVSAPVSICEGSSKTLTASGSAGIYNWHPGNLSGPVIIVAPTVTTTYTVTLTTNCNTLTDTVTVKVSPLPLVNFSADVMQGCAPLCIQFRDQSSGIVTQWTWAFGNGDTSKEASPIYCYKTPGSYSVSLTAVSNIRCSSTLKVMDMITVYSPPIAAFTYSPQPATIMNPTIQFTDLSTDPYSIIYWFWTFGDSQDSTSTLKNPAHTYLDTGIYCPNLVVMDLHGCTDTVTECLDIEPFPTLYIPDAFTPNGDGLNDVFTAKGEYIKTFDMSIYDRWGMELYHTNNIDKGWNGTVDGGSTVAQEDIYVYVINVTDAMDNAHKYIGKVTLLK